MNITSAKFIKGITGPDESLDDGLDQIAFIGRSNVGKSSVINTLANQKDLARTSSFPGRTQEINLFLISAKGISSSFYLVDLPGYGFAKTSKDTQEQIQQLIYWYFFDSPYEQKKVVLIIDASVGVTNTDAEMLFSLKEANKDILVVANKIDKIKKTALAKQLKEIREAVGNYKVIPYSAEKKQGINELANEILK
ncbi:MAG: ribosome biogenesis GTP-binding protein YsxC [Candidatus Doudnabacteria bacterium]|nr:ribosome biogenesis GTP-binding protein YsxC [Candidatus Doudnabacteria bacterium]